MNGQQVLGYLSRGDKWFLGGGKAVVWAPEFPTWLDTPGFWDHACYLDYRVGPLFTLAIVDQRGREVKPRLLERFWQPDHSSQLYRDKSRDLVITERRALLPWDVLVSTFEFANSLPTDQTFDLVLWSAQEREGGTRQGPSVSEIEGFRVRDRDGTLVWKRRVRETGLQPNGQNPDEAVLMRFAVALSASRKADSYCIKLSDRQPNQPRWLFTPFYEKLARYGGASLGDEAPEGIPADFGGLVYFGLHYKITVPANDKVQFSAYAAIAKNEEEALLGLTSARRNQPAAKGQETLKPSKERRPTWPAKRHWAEYFDNLPSFTCSDPFLQKYYWYRWFGLRLNTIRVEDARLGLHYPCIFEGINLGWFRQAITYSAQCHMFETRWMHTPEVAQGSLLNFIENQYENGSFPGAIKNIYQGDRSLRVGIAFYHANWGQALRAVHSVHPDRAFLQRIYEPLVKYLLYFDRERDPDQTGLYDVINHWETGQEFMSRYTQVDPKADEGGPLRLKGLDATTYIYQLQLALAWMGDKLGRADETARWRNMAEKTRQAVQGQMWDAEKEFFFDVNPANGQRISAKTAIGFYPFMTGLAGPEHLGAINKHLFNPEEFWTKYPVPSTSVDDPTFSGDGEWKEQRLVCPWNGRTWLMTNSHVAEALCQAAQELDPALQPRAVEFLNRYIRMPFLDGDVERPSSYEYYNPFTGQAPFFRGTEDYMHSWIVDLIIKYVAGVQPGEDGRVQIRPLPFELDYFTLDRVKIAGQNLKVTWRKDEKAAREAAQALRQVRPSPLEAEASAPVGLAVYVNGELAQHLPRLGSTAITL
jgi:hypothetical protein